MITSPMDPTTQSDFFFDIGAAQLAAGVGSVHAGSVVEVCGSGKTKGKKRRQESKVPRITRKNSRYSRAKGSKMIQKRLDPLVPLKPLSIISLDTWSLGPLESCSTCHLNPPPSPNNIYSNLPLPLISCTIPGNDLEDNRTR